MGIYDLDRYIICIYVVYLPTYMCEFAVHLLYNPRYVFRNPMSICVIVCDRYARTYEASGSETKYDNRILQEVGGGNTFHTICSRICCAMYTAENKFLFHKTGAI